MEKDLNKALFSDIKQCSFEIVRKVSRTLDRMRLIYSNFLTSSPVRGIFLFGILLLEIVKRNFYI